MIRIEEELDRAKQLHEIGASNQAIKRLEKILEKQGDADAVEDKVRLILALGKIWFDIGNRDEALKSLRDARTKAEDAPQTPKMSVLKREATLYLSAVYQQKGDLKAATVLCQEIISEQIVDSALIQAYRNLSYINFSQGNFSETIDYLNRVIELDPDFNHSIASDIFYVLGRSYSGLGHINESIHYLEKAAEVSAPGKGHAENWQIYLSLAHVIKQVPGTSINDRTKYYHKVIELLESDTKKVKHPFSSSKGKHLPPQITDTLFAAYHDVGLIYFLEGEYKEAIKYFTKGLKVGSQKQPMFAGIHLLLGQSYLKIGNNRKAQKTYKALLKIDPQHQWVQAPPIYRDLAQTYYNEKEYRQSLKYLLKVLDLETVDDSTLADIHLGIGHNYFALGVFAQASRHYREALKLSDPTTPEREIAMKYLMYANDRTSRKS